MYVPPNGTWFIPTAGCGDWEGPPHRVLLFAQIIGYLHRLAHPDGGPACAHTIEEWRDGKLIGFRRALLAPRSSA